MTDLYLVQIFMLRKNMIQLNEAGHIISVGNDIYKLPKEEIKQEWDGFDISNHPRSMPQVGRSGPQLRKRKKKRVTI